LIELYTALDTIIQIKKRIFMQTIQFQIEDDLYKSLLSRGINLQVKFQDFLMDLVDDGYPSISTDEAKKRVAKAIDDYKHNRDKSFSLLGDDFWSELNNKIDNAK